MAVRVIDVRERVMERNDEIARAVRLRREEAGLPALNLVSSPGAGKTALLERTLDALRDEIEIAIVTGDCQTQNDADRLAAHTSHLVQAVVTGGACHLDARQVERALNDIAIDDTDLLIIENVGNLVCPASWDIGEDAKVVLLSVTEGEDKPEKYPKIFRESDYAVITKMDLLPYVPFNVAKAVGFMRDANPFIRVFYTSATSGEGMEEWLEFLRDTARRGSSITKVARR